jgi:suppressor for copper-sensitivity B
MPASTPSPFRRRPRRTPAVRLAALLSLALIGLSPTSQAQLARVEKASLGLVADRTAYEPGAEARIEAVMTIESGWHSNSHQPTFEYLIPTQISFTLPAEWPPPGVDYPPGQMKTFAFEEQPLSVYEGEVTITGRFRIPPDTAEGQWPITVELTYQACDDRSCLPPVTTRQTMPLQVGGEGRLTQTARLSPPAASAPQPARLLWILLLALLGGLILNTMPCVLPVLSLKVFGLVKSAGKGRADVVVGALATAAGILLSFWALAAAAVLARSAGAAVGWGVQFQEPTFVAALAVVVVLFCLNLWGLFEIPLPARLARLADSGPKEGVPGHLVSGLFATLMATPCSAPFLGTALGFALSQPAGVILAVFTAVAVGMALPYLALAAAPEATRFLPRPGPWMDHLKVVMGFLLAGAAIWLFYVLAAQLSAVRLALIELMILVLALFIWMRHRAGSHRALRTVALLGVLAAIALAIGLAAGGHRAPSSRLAEASSGLITWATFDRQEAERLADQGRLVFVDVTADWCFTCKVNERLVLETPEVADAFSRHQVVPMKADWTNRSDAIARFLADHGRYGIPFYLLYRPGREPHVFAELLTKQGLIGVLEEAAAGSSTTRPTQD